jgi:hypothetical protein
LDIISKFDTGWTSQLTQTPDLDEQNEEVKDSVIFIFNPAMATICVTATASVLLTRQRTHPLLMLTQLKFPFSRLPTTIS